MRKAKGFTLIELMIVVVIVAILMAVAVPSYQDSVRKTRRADGKSLVLRVAQLQERHFTENNQYATTLVGTASATILGLADALSDEGHYQVSLAASAANSFTLRVTPRGAQTSDTKCGYLELSNVGVKASEHGTDCW